MLFRSDQQGLDFGRIVRVPAVGRMIQGSFLLALSDRVDDVLLPLPCQVLGAEQGARRCLDPFLAIWRETACRDQSMDVGIESEVATEGVTDQHDSRKEQLPFACHALAVFAGLGLGSPDGQ